MAAVDWTPEFRSPPSSLFIRLESVRVADGEMQTAELRPCPGLDERPRFHKDAFSALPTIAFRPSARYKGERILSRDGGRIRSKPAVYRNRNCPMAYRTPQAHAQCSSCLPEAKGQVSLVFDLFTAFSSPVIFLKHPDGSM